MSTWAHDDVVRLLARETIYSHAQVEQAVEQLWALGWTPWQCRRGILAVARGLLSLRSLWHAVELAGGDVDAILDALTPTP